MQERVEKEIAPVARKVNKIIFANKVDNIFFVIYYRKINFVTLEEL